MVRHFALKTAQSPVWTAFHMDPIAITVKDELIDESAQFEWNLEEPRRLWVGILLKAGRCRRRVYHIVFLESGVPKQRHCYRGGGARYTFEKSSEYELKNLHESL